MALARWLDGHGIGTLHLVDIDGAALDARDQVDFTEVGDTAHGGGGRAEGGPADQTRA